jgi:hypothetical protein
VVGDLTATAPGVQGSDHVVVTPPGDWTSKNMTVVTSTSSNTVHVEICNQTAALQNLGTAANIKFLVFR